MITLVIKKFSWLYYFIYSRLGKNAYKARNVFEYFMRKNYNNK